MQIREQIGHRQPSIRTFSLQKSNSVAAKIIYCGQGSPEYADSLASFKKDYATWDREDREKYQARKHQSLERKKQQHLIREIQAKQNQQTIQNKLQNRQIKSQQLYKSGNIKNTLINSLPVNPLNSEYELNERGKTLQRRDEDKGLNRIVRAHYLHTLGNSGYNIINGKSSINVESYVPVHRQEVFQQKINQLYSRFRLHPQ